MHELEDPVYKDGDSDDATETDAGALAVRPKKSVSKLEGPKYKEVAVRADAMDIDQGVVGTLRPKRA